MATALTTLPQCAARRALKEAPLFPLSDVHGFLLASLRLERSLQLGSEQRVGRERKQRVLFGARVQTGFSALALWPFSQYLKNVPQVKLTPNWKLVGEMKGVHVLLVTVFCAV